METCAVEAEKYTTPGDATAMTNSQFASIFSVIFLLAAVPLLLVQPFGDATAGLNTGFAAALGSPLYMAMVVGIGFAGNFLGNGAFLKLPLGFLLMLFVASALSIPLEYSRLLTLYILLAILLFGFVVCQLANREHGVKRYMLAVTLMSLLAFHYGHRFMEKIPVIASPTYYLLSQLIAASFLLGMGMASGVVLAGEAHTLAVKALETRAVRALREWIGA